MLWWFIGVWLASGAVIPALLALSTASRGVLRNIEAEQRLAAEELHSAATSASVVQSADNIRGLISSLSMLAFRQPGHRSVDTGTTPKASPIGQLVVSGLISVGALALLFVSSFSDSSLTMRDLPSAFAVGQAPMTRAAPEMRPIQALASAAQVSEKSAQDDTAGEPGMAWRGSQSDPVSLGKAEQVASIQPRTGNMGDSAGADVGRQTPATAPPVPNTEALLTAPGYPRLPGSDRGSGHRRTHTYGVSVRPYAIRSSRGTWLFPPAPNAGANS